MTDKESWHARLLAAPNVCLILGGLILLFGVGPVKVGPFEFRPFEDILNIARLVLIMAGLILILAGATLHLHQAGIWRPGLGRIYFGLSVLLVIGFGTAITITQPKIITVESPPVILRPAPTAHALEWTAYRTHFVAVVRTDDLAKHQRYAQGSNLFLACRVQDSTIDRKDDLSIQKSTFFRIEGLTKEITVNFTRDFSERLTDDSTIECTICLIPKSVSRDSIKTIGDVDDLGGEIHRHISAGVSFAEIP